MQEHQAYAGLLVFVVGGSGVGKDSLLSGARQRLKDNTNFCFPKRLITRKSIAELEDHESISFGEFSQKVDAGEAALSWEAHGLGYIIPKSIEADLHCGKIVVCNVSRSIIAIAAMKYPIHVANIVADIDVRAQRLAKRGRENEADIKQRLARAQIPLPSAIPVTQIANNGALAQSVRVLVEKLTVLQKETNNH